MTYSTTESALHAVIAAVPELADHYAGIPEYVGSRTGMDRLDAEIAEHVRTLRHARTDYETRFEQLVAAAAADEPLPDDLDELTPPPETTATIHVLTAAANRLGQAWDQAARDGIPGGLHALHDAATTAIAQARTLGLAGMDAETAIRLGRADAYTTVQDLREVYNRCRDAQATLARQLYTQEYSQELPRWAAIANVPRVWPEWATWRRDTATAPDQGWVYATRPTTIPPWPVEDAGQLFDWLCEHTDAEPWVPDLDQLRQAVANAHTQRTATNGADVDHTNGHTLASIIAVESTAPSDWRELPHDTH